MSKTQAYTFESVGLGKVLYIVLLSFMSILSSISRKSIGVIIEVHLVPVYLPLPLTWASYPIVIIR
ncbi:hypothetical protein [Xanthocytophaga flava]|uniref:hypothetical protein n=1 Tax=Xanthocytophaga flava TaxID=3048013 RepID=UPI0028D743DA|nr:hypothetical protein [Xanthocytophaga flavus]